MPKLVTNLWFDAEAEEAATFYCKVFPNSAITGIARYPAGAPGPEGAVMTVDFVLDGTPFTAINGGPQFPFTEAVSILIECADQEEVDHYWDALTADGGEESQCGWLKDRYGLSWQVVPAGIAEAFADPNTAAKATQAMLGMRRIDVAELRRAAGLD